MSAQGISVTKNRGRPRGEPTSVVRLPDSLLTEVDAWISRQPEPRPSRPEGIRRLLADALGGTDAGSIAAEDLNASNDE